MEFFAPNSFRSAELEERNYTAKADHVAAAREDFIASWKGCDSVPRWLVKQLDRQTPHRLHDLAQGRLKSLTGAYVFGGDTPAKRKSLHVQTIFLDLNYETPETIVGLYSPAL
jgi:hypothetical protein